MEANKMTKSAAKQKGTATVVILKEYQWNY